MSGFNLNPIIRLLIVMLAPISIIVVVTVAILFAVLATLFFIIDIILYPIIFIVTGESEFNSHLTDVLLDLVERTWI